MLYSIISLTLFWISPLLVLKVNNPKIIWPRIASNSFKFIIIELCPALKLKSGCVGINSLPKISKNVASKLPDNIDWKSREIKSVTGFGYTFRLKLSLISIFVNPNGAVMHAVASIFLVSTLLNKIFAI